MNLDIGRVVEELILQLTSGAVLHAFRYLHVCKSARYNIPTCLLLHSGTERIIDNCNGLFHHSSTRIILFFRSIQRLVQATTIASLLARRKSLHSEIVVWQCLICAFHRMC